MEIVALNPAGSCAQHRKNTTVNIFRSGATSWETLFKRRIHLLRFSHIIYIAVTVTSFLWKLLP